MKIEDYFALYTMLSGAMSGMEAWQKVEKEHYKVTGRHKCTSYASFRALRSRFYRQLRG